MAHRRTVSGSLRSRASAARMSIVWAVSSFTDMSASSKTRACLVVSGSPNALRSLR